MEKEYEESDDNEVRTYKDIILDCGKDGKAYFTISLPKNIPEEGLPCILIVGGLMTGRESLRFIPQHGHYALVAYEYSNNLKKLQKIDILWNLFSVRRDLFQVPFQLIKMVKYLQERPWFRSEPIEFMGYSFGSVFIPLTYVKAQKQKINLGPAVMAYGGANIYCLLRANLKLPKFLKEIIAQIGAYFFKEVDPIFYAPKMKGRFLIINGIYDKQVPFECAKILQDIIPEPKTVINLDSEHMSPENTELTLDLIRISRKWLKEQHNQDR